MLQEPRFLSAEQFLLTTLIVKLAIMAVLATMLASDAASAVRGQIIGARGNDIILYNHPRPVRILHRDGGWTPESLAEAMPVMSSMYTRIAPGSDPMKWGAN